MITRGHGDSGSGFGDLGLDGSDLVISTISSKSTTSSSMVSRGTNSIVVLGCSKSIISSKITTSSSEVSGCSNWIISSKNTTSSEVSNSLWDLFGAMIICISTCNVVMMIIYHLIKIDCDNPFFSLPFYPTKCTQYSTE